MKKVMLAASSLVLSLSIAHAGSDIGVINMPQVLKASPEVHSIRQSLKKEFKPQVTQLKALQVKLEKQMMNLKKNDATMTKLEKTQANKVLRGLQTKYQHQQARFQTAYIGAQNKALGRLMKQMQTTISHVAKKHDLDLVISKTAVAYNKRDLDITMPVIKALNK